MDHGTTFRLGYRPALDGIRGIAILTVLAFHTLHIHYPEGFYLFQGGFIGVDLFFVLSGFLITTLLVDEHRVSGRIDLRTFYVRRALRLVPALALLLASVVVLSGLLYVINRDPQELTDALGAVAAVALYVSNWVEAFGLFTLGPLGPTWSLGIEGQFYLIWPLLVVLLLRLGVSAQRMLTVVCAAAAGLAVWRAVVYAGTDSVERVYYGTDTHGDLLLWGCALGLIATHGWLPSSALGQRRLGQFAILGALVLAVTLFAVPYGSPVMFYGGYVIVAAAGFALIAWLLTFAPDKGPALLRSRFLTWIGGVSYGIYLWHYLIIYVLARAAIVRSFGLPTWAIGAVELVIVGIGSAVIAAVSYRLVEKPFLKRKPRRQAAPLDVPTPRVGIGETLKQS